MKKITKLLMTYMCAGAFLIGMNTTALAFEDTIATNDDVTDITHVTAEVVSGEVNVSNETISQEANDSDLVNENPLMDGYEIFTDEQGQEYYIEIDNETIEIQKTSAMDTKETVKKETTEKKKETTEKKKETTEIKKVETKKAKTVKATYSEKDLRLLASLIYAEAGNQSYDGMLAVANVVLNRVDSNSYNHVSTIKEAIHDKKWAVQFAVTVKSKKTGVSMLDKALDFYDTGKYPGRDTAIEKKAMNKAIKAAKAALEGENNIGSFLCFNGIESGTRRIKSKYSSYKIIGDHIFYRTK